ncbi:hypothetical protein [Anaerosacchariphilus polymeriproducens]|uniref:Uncharacterized protein n=1 Tax=Anaerosacchariphilus polymeriproducens TaxID=1812858 RepID=A0A371AYB7_9FIRM|nr:hypothetical protein [Anaerosacchariphilus polymeriproducens]RDU24585.1 hypothetical protein DWV06_03725 [Anaerosacchariphilus polymeriproducens]
MSDFIETTTKSLETVISEIADNPSLFLRNPSADFSRKRKIDFKTLIGITMNSGGYTMSKELLLIGSCEDFWSAFLVKLFRW